MEERSGSFDENEEKGGICFELLMLNRSVYLLPSSSVHDIFWNLHEVSYKKTIDSLYVVMTI
jgi:hypothetical protein